MQRQPAIVIGLIVACVLPELAVCLAPQPDALRIRLVEAFAFWPGLLDGTLRGFPAQREVMFLSYGLLHAGLLHLFFNMMTLASLGPPLVARLGTPRFTLLYLVSQIGGGLGYGLLAPAAAPMVGASGALFGLCGALLWMQLRYGLRRGRGRQVVTRVAVSVLMLILFNVAMYAGMNGLLAWQAHFGGFVAGVLVMALLCTGPALPVMRP